MNSIVIDIIHKNGEIEQKLVCNCKNCSLFRRLGYEILSYKFKQIFTIVEMSEDGKTLWVE